MQWRRHMWFLAGVGAVCVAAPGPARANTFVVTSVQNDGPGSFRQALIDANATAEPDEIDFNTSSHFILIGDPLPAITAPLTIDGASRPGHTDNTDPSGFNANINVWLEENRFPASPGLEIRADNVTVNGIGIEEFSPGILVASGSGTRITGSVVGNPGGGLPPDETTQGIRVDGGTETMVGGLAIEETNMIVGRGIGVQTAVPQTAVIGNAIAANFIGVDLGPAATGSAVQLNFIGPSGPYRGNQTGVRVRGSGNAIGGPNADAQGNTIDDNGAGLLISGSDNVVQGNEIASNRGTGAAVTNGVRNTIRATPIFANGGLGIDLGAAGVLTNDPFDADAGPNGLQNHPVLTSAVTSGGVTTLTGTFDGAPNTELAIDLFASSACDPSGYGEGETLVGSAGFRTDGNGHADTSVALPSFPNGTALTTTATTADGTSEFSACATAGTPAAAVAMPVVAPVVVPVVRDTTAPVILALTFTPAKFAVAPGATPIGKVAAVRRGTTIGYRLSEPAQVELRIERLERGRKVGKRCLPDTRARRHQRACSRPVAAGSLRRAATAGANTLRFTGRIGSRALRPASYRATARAVDAAGNKARERSATFRIVPRP